MHQILVKHVISPSSTGPQCMFEMNAFVPTEPTKPTSNKLMPHLSAVSVYNCIRIILDDDTTYSKYECERVLNTKPSIKCHTIDCIRKLERVGLVRLHAYISFSYLESKQMRCHQFIFFQQISRLDIVYNVSQFELLLLVK